MHIARSTLGRRTPRQTICSGCLAEEFKKLGVETETIRLADHDIKTGVTSDENEGNAWPKIREQVLAADILLIGSFIWLGRPLMFSSRRWSAGMRF